MVDDAKLAERLKRENAGLRRRMRTADLAIRLGPEIADIISSTSLPLAEWDELAARLVALQRGPGGDEVDP